MGTSHAQSFQCQSKDYERRCPQLKAAAYLTTSLQFQLCNAIQSIFPYCNAKFDLGHDSQPHTKRIARCKLPAICTDLWCWGHFCLVSRNEEKGCGDTIRGSGAAGSRRSRYGGAFETAGCRGAKPQRSIAESRRSSRAAKTSLRIHCNERNQDKAPLSMQAKS